MIGRLIHHPSNNFTECLFQARLELDAGGDLEWAEVLPVRAQAGHTCVRYVQSRALRPERTDTDPTGPGQAS